MKKTLKQWLYESIPMITGITVLTIVLVFWQALLFQEHKQMERTLHIKALALKNKIEESIELHVKSLTHIGEEWENTGGMDKQKWNTQIEMYLKNHESLQSIQWIDREYNIRMLTSKKGEVVFEENMNFEGEDKRKIAMEIAKEKHEIHSTEFFNLIDGKKGFTIYYPLFLNGGEEFDGFIEAVIYTDTLLGSLSEEFLDNFAVAIFHSEERVYGEAEMEKNIYKAHVNLHGSLWSIWVAPKDVWFTKVSSPVPELTLIIGVFMAGILGGFAYLAQQSQRREKKIVVTRKELKKNVEDLQKFKFAVENATDQIIITDPTGIILYANKAAESVSGFTPNELIGKKTNWQGKMGTVFFQKLWDTISEKKQRHTSEISNERKDGTEYIANLSVSPILDGKKEILFFIGIERDMTQEKKAICLQHDLLSLLSHDMQLHLGILKENISSLTQIESKTLLKKHKQSLQKIEKSTELLEKFVSDSLIILSHADTSRKKSAKKIKKKGNKQILSSKKLNKKG